MKTHFRADKYDIVSFSELEDGDLFIDNGKLYMKETRYGYCISDYIEVDANYTSFDEDEIVTKVISISILRM